MTKAKSDLLCRAALLAALAVSLTSMLRAQSIPTDPKATCVVTPAMFASWFATGTPAVNGVVNPANSVTFPNTGNCSFYQWSEQMFLWLTSPAPSQYGGDGRVFDSPVFYDVSAVDANGNRSFLPHVPGQLRFFNVRTSQAGPHGLPVIFDRTGRMLEVERPQIAPSGRQLIRNSAGSLVEVGRVTLGVNRRPAFLDPGGRPITPQLAPRPAVAAARTKNPLTVQRFFVGGLPIFVDPFGNVLDVEEGQAGGGGALLAQNGSLIYYTTIVNDVYAWFLTAAKTGGITPAPTQFPTTQANLNQITAYASKFGVTFPDPNALAIEVKAAWIETSNLPNPGNYLTMTATIPIYDKSNPNQWVPTGGSTTAQLAMVGMHVVGSTAGHPEMVWATFEHVGNTPFDTYQYINTSSQTITVNQNTSGTWLFSNGSTANFNLEIAEAACNNINGVPPPIDPTKCPPPAPTVKIAPTNVIRWKPWGASFDKSPNPLDPSAAASNTEVISIHNTVTVPGGDVRNNYFMTGATWTIAGAAPLGQFNVIPNGNEVGTSFLSNSTMETFQQGTGNTSASGTNCFSCHTTNTTSVSHVYGALLPLTPIQMKGGK